MSKKEGLMSERKLTIGVVFGSRSVEHDVSVVSATQVMHALTPKYEVVPIYIARDGRWFTGKNLATLRNFDIDDIAQLAGITETTLSANRDFQGLITPPLVGRLGKNSLQKLDVLFPVIHGSHGEDGTIQGLFAMVDLPYVGAGVMASAIGNDKIMTKTVLKARGLPVLEKFLRITRKDWADNRDSLLDKIESEVGYPAFVKPNTLGSSIGIARPTKRDEAARHIDIALNMDRHVLIEEAAPGAEVFEINCALLGNDEVRASTLEQPMSYDEILTFGDKYLKGGGKGMKGQDRIIPAPISDEMTAKIKAAAVDAFKTIGCMGTALIDFLANSDEQFWINEINTMPGSLAFYLWEPEGMTATDVCAELIRLALERQAEKMQTTFDYKTDLIKLAASRGTKGGKSI
jgi:D-alanine-D-alanine ligase